MNTIKEENIVITFLTESLKDENYKNLIKFDFPAARKWRADARYVLANKGQS